MKTLGRIMLGLVVMLCIAAFFVDTPPPTETELVTEKREYAAKKERDAKLNAEVRARDACLNAVRAQAKFPTKLSWGWDLTTGRVRNSDLLGVRGRVDLMNEFGAMIPHVFACDVRGTEVVTIVVQPG